MGDTDRFAGSGILHAVLRAGAVIRKLEEGGFTGIFQADAGVGGGLSDLFAGGELGVLVSYIPAAAVAVRHMGMGGRVEVFFASDVQPGVIVNADELGAGCTLAIVVVQRLIGHQQLQELVTAGAQRADFRDGIRIVIHGAEPGDATLHLALDKQVRRAKAALRAGILAGGVGDIVDHDTHDAAIAPPGFAGQRVGVVVRQHTKTGVQLFAFRQRRSDSRLRRSRRGSSFRGCSRAGRSSAQAQCFLKPGRKAIVYHGAAACAAAGKRQRRSSGSGNAKNGTASDLHRYDLLNRSDRAEKSGPGDAFQKRLI